MEVQPEENNKNYSEAFYYIMKSTRYCGKKCNTLKPDKMIDMADLECLSFFINFLDIIFIPEICSINYLKSTELHKKFILGAAESNMEF